MLHILTGKAVQHAFCGHLLLDQCLTDQIVSKIIKTNQDLRDLLRNLEQLFCQVENGEIYVDIVLESDSMGKTVHT